MAWTRGRLLFENVPLVKAVAEVNRYSKDVRIELADPRLEQLRVSGSYLAGDAELVVAAWEATLPVRARHHDGRIILTRKCRSEPRHVHRSDEHTSELQSLMRISSAVICLHKKNTKTKIATHTQSTMSKQTKKS